MSKDELARHSRDPDSERLLHHEGQSDIDLTLYPRKKQPKARRHLTPILIVSNITTFVVVISLLAFRPAPSPTPPAPVNLPPGGVAPTLAHLIQPTAPRLFNYSFYDDGSWTRKHDSVEADQMWDSYTQVSGGFVMIPRDEAAQADIDPSRHAYIDRPDLGMVGHPAIPEALHQMHCVDTLRRNLYYNIEHTRAHCAPPHCVPGKEGEAEEGDRLHVDHCLELIRLRIECTADLGVVPFMWYGRYGRLTGDVKRRHTCGSYEAVRRFVAENGVDPPDGALRWPEGQFYVDDFV